MAPHSTQIIEWASMALGLALAPAFPTTINYAKQTLGAAMSGSVLSLLMFSGTMGGVFLPQIAGQYIKKVPVGKGGIESGPEAMMHLLFGAILLGTVVMALAARVAPGAHVKIE